MAALLLIWSLSNNDGIETRYVAPIYSCLMALGATFIAIAWSATKSPWLRLAMIFAIAAITAPNLAKSIKLLKHRAPNQSMMIATTHRHAPFDWNDLRPLRAQLRDRNPNRNTGSNQSLD